VHTGQCNPLVNAIPQTIIPKPSNCDISAIMADIDKAIEWLQSQEKANCAEAVRKFKIHPTTMWRRWYFYTVSRAEATSIHTKLLTTAQELELIKYINKLSDRGLPPTHQILENLVVEIVKHPIGENWTHNFVERYADTIKSVYLRPLDNSRKIADISAHFEHFYQTVCPRP